MRKFILLISIFLLPVASALAEDYAEFNLPNLIWLDHNQREDLKASLSASDTLPSQLLAMFEHAEKAARKNPSPIEKIHYQGLVANHPDRLETVKNLEDMLAIRALAWTAWFKEDAFLADACFQYLDAWAQTYVPTGNDVNENKLTYCFLAYDLLHAKYPDKNWEPVQEWLHTVSRKQKDTWTKRGSSNRHAKRLKQILLGALIFDDKELLDFAQNIIEEFLQHSLRPDGTTRDLERRDAMHYNASNVKAILQCAIIYRSLGRDVYNFETPSGSSLKNSVAYIVPYVKGEKTYAEWVNTTVQLDRDRWATGDPFYRPGTPWDPSEGISLLLLSSVFEPEYLPIAQTLNQKYKGDPIDWQAELVKFAAH